MKHAMHDAEHVGHGKGVVSRAIQRVVVTFSNFGSKRLESDVHGSVLFVRLETRQIDGVW